MKTKMEFLLALELDENTRLLKSEEELRQAIKTVLASAARQFTAGSIPKVEVTLVNRLGEDAGI